MPMVTLLARSPRLVTCREMGVGGEVQGHCGMGSGAGRLGTGAGRAESLVGWAALG